ncbi:helix-turn-helix domain-containing protein [Amycolatopsis thailandensis]|uniref:helix-turn-helix domain-containing protein n=1 Tax=Amycolatopsis thailandensis TaxID=589330 RepID=UPI003626920E
MSEPSLRSFRWPPRRPSIAKGAGISRGSLYFYFGSKQEVLAALVARTVASLHLDGQSADPWLAPARHRAKGRGEHGPHRGHDSCPRRGRPARRGRPDRRGGARAGPVLDDRTQLLPRVDTTRRPGSHDRDDGRDLVPCPT